MGLKACHFKTMKVFQERDYTLFGLCKSQHRHAKVSSRLCFRSSPPHACPASLQLSRNLWYSSSRVVTVSHTPAPNTQDDTIKRAPRITTLGPSKSPSHAIIRDLSSASRGPFTAGPCRLPYMGSVDVLIDKRMQNHASREIDTPGATRMMLRRRVACDHG
jgi:hypothetical protein